MSNRLSATQTRILDVLNDGLPHTRRELETLLYDDMPASTACLLNHLKKIRDALAEIGHDIVCVQKDKTYYYRRVVLYVPGRDD